MVLSREFLVLKELVRYRLYSIRHTFIDEFINMAIWVVGTILVMGYLMQSFGLRADFGMFQFGGLLAFVGLFEFWPFIANFLVDIEGDNIFGYHATLPCRLKTVLFSYIFAQAIVTFILSLFILPIGKLLLWSQFSLTAVSWPMLILVLLAINIFFAILGLWIASIVKSMEHIGNVWMRMIWPMWMFGGFQLSFASIRGVWPMFAYVNLINPVIYASEGVRGALIGGNFMNTWLCLGAIILFSLAMFYDLHRRFVKLLDLV